VMQREKFIDGLEDILVPIHTAQHILYPENGGTNLAQYTSNYLPIDTTPKAPTAEPSLTSQLEPHNPFCVVYLLTVTMHGTQCRVTQRYRPQACIQEVPE